MCKIEDSASDFNTDERTAKKTISYTPETQKRVLGQILSIFQNGNNHYELACKNCFSSSVRSQYAFLRSVARRFALEVWLRGCFFS